MKELVIAITGASGIEIGATLLQMTADMEQVRTHLVISANAEQTMLLESEWTSQSLADLADEVYDVNDVGASIASGSFSVDAMIIAPCSMSTLGQIAAGITPNLVTRAADVTLKERRPLVLVPREAPLSLIHLSNMVTLTQAGATIFPPVPAFYLKPSSVAEVVTQIAGRCLDQVGINSTNVRRWT